MYSLSVQRENTLRPTDGIVKNERLVDSSTPLVYEDANSCHPDGSGRRTVCDMGVLISTPESRDVFLGECHAR